MQVRRAFLIQLALAAALTWAQMTTENPVSISACEREYPGVNVSAFGSNLKNPSNDEKCFIKCELEDLRMIDDKGQVNETVVIEMFKNETYQPEFSNELKECIAINDHDLCNKAYVFYTCVLEAIHKYEESVTTMASLVDGL